MFVNVYKSETTNVSGWYFSGHICIVNLRIVEQSLLFNILWLKNNECLLFGKDMVNEKYALPFEVLDHLLIVNFWLALYLAINTCHFIFGKMLCVWQSFLTCVLCCMDLYLYLKIWYLKIWLWCLLVAVLMTKKFVRVYSYNFVLWLSHWIYGQVSTENEYWLKVNL